MDKLGIVSVYKKVNYGTVLQAYALQVMFDEMGYKNEIISMEGIEKQLNKKKLFYFFTHLLQNNFLFVKLSMLKKCFYVKVNWKGIKNKVAVRKNKFDDFINTYIRFSPAFDNLDDLRKYSENYKAVIAGSDQIWLPQHIDGGYYTLTWVPENVQRLSYATSFGISDLPVSIVKKTKKFLQQMNTISVREMSGKKIVEELSEKKVEVVCDPTMMVDVSFWNEISGQSRIIKPKYIFCYFIGSNKMHRKTVQKLKEMTGLPIVALLHLDEYIGFDEKYADIMPYDIGPIEFINILKNAEFVMTDSFHGTVFSILFHKAFWTFYRYKKNCKMSTNSRIQNILELLGLEGRLVKNVDSFSSSHLLCSVDYHNVDEQLKIIRKKSYTYIKNVLGDKRNE